MRFLGCGGEGAATAPVSGVVTYRGKPLADVNVVFMSRGGAPATGVTNSEGRFELTTLDQTGAVPGAHQVTITPNQGAIDMPLPDVHLVQGDDADSSRGVGLFLALLATAGIAFGGRLGTGAGPR